MNSTAAAETHPASRKYSSPPYALIWFFRKSRDNWKRKYLVVKAELKRVCRRLDRHDQAKASSQPCAAKATRPGAAKPTVANPAQSATSCYPVASLIDFLHQECLVLQQQLEHNREILQQCQQQNRELEDLAQQINRLQQRLDSAAAPESATSPPPAQPPRPATHTAAVQPLAKIPHQAPQEPKKGGLLPASPLTLPQAGDAATAASGPGSNKTHRFPTPLVQLAVDLVCTAGVSLRGTPKVLDVVQRALRLPWDIPHWTSVRNWLLRAGLARWRKGLRQADDWLVLADHSVQIGTEKCLVGVGIRQADYQRLPRCLTLEDVTLLQLEVMPRSTKADVAGSLQQLSQTVGVPRGVTHDNAADLAGGARLLKKQHRQVRSIVDCKHKAACLLKKRLHKDSRWQEFQKQLGQSKAQIQQTELAFLASPSQRSKARYMNVDKLVVWAEKVLAVLDGKLDLGVPIKLPPERLQEKLGWLRGYREELLKWREWLRTIEVVVGYVGWHGLTETTAERLTEELGSSSQTALGQELISFVREQTSELKAGERIPGSTEVVESCMGKLKKLTGEHSKGGFTGLLLALGAVVGPKSGLDVADLFAQVSTKDVRAWIKTHLGHTVQSARRRLGLAFRKAQQKRHPPKLALP